MSAAAGGLRPLRLELAGFRGWRGPASLALDRPLTLIVGENGRGKSSALVALEWCLFGREAERKKSGIPERSDWRADHGAGAPVEVSLVLGPGGPGGPDCIGGGEVRVRRLRGPSARARDADPFEVQTPAGEHLAGAAAEAWLRGTGLPDWSTWRRAFCQHQETARARLIEGADRSAAVAALLGLDAYDELHRTLAETRPARLVRALDEEQERLEAELLRRLREPDSELTECERRLEALGLERARLGPELAQSLARAMLERARRLAELAGVEAVLPASAAAVDEPELRRWAEGWASELRGRARTAERLQELVRRQAGLRGELEHLEPSEERWKRARAALEEELQRGGDGATRRELLERAERTLAEAEDRLRRAGEREALLRDALELVLSLIHI